MKNASRNAPNSAEGKYRASGIRVTVARSGVNMKSSESNDGDRIHNLELFRTVAPVVTVPIAFLGELHRPYSDDMKPSSLKSMSR